MKRLIYLGMCVILSLLMIGNAACAETVEGDLDARYANVPSIEYNGETYQLRKRLTTLLFVGVAAETAEEAAGELRIEFAAAIIVDDNQKRITPIQIDPMTPVSVGETAEVPLRMICEGTEIKELDYERILQAVNSLMPDELMENYFVLNLDDLAEYDADLSEDVSSVDRYKARLKAFKAYAEQLSTSEQADLLTEYSDSILSDMKSGAIMKVADKASRYEILHSWLIPAQWELGADEQEVLNIDKDALLAEIVEVFYEQKER